MTPIEFIASKKYKIYNAVYEKLGTKDLVYANEIYMRILNTIETTPEFYDALENRLKLTFDKAYEGIMILMDKLMSEESDDKPDIRHKILSAHAMALKDLNDALISIVSNTGMFADFMAADTISAVSPSVSVQRLMIERYGDPPNEALFTDEDIKLMKQAVIKSDAFRGKTKISLDTKHAIIDLQKKALDLIESVDNITYAINCAKINDEIDDMIHKTCEDRTDRTIEGDLEEDTQNS